MKKILFLLTLSISILSCAHAKLNVVCALTDFADIAKTIGGDYVEVSAVSRGNEDPHFVDPKPSFIARLAKADIAIVNGLELDQWMDYLIENSRNPKIQAGQLGYLNASNGLPIIEVPKLISRSEGDLHPGGNPHYMLDPQNGIKVAASIAEKISTLDPAHAKSYQDNLEKFKATLNTKNTEWKSLLGSLSDKRLIDYHSHSGWDYFAAAFGLSVVDTLEPKAGITPPPSHSVNLSQRIAREKIKVLVIDPFYSSAIGERLRNDNPSLKILILPSASGGIGKTPHYIDMLDYNVHMIYSTLSVQAARQLGS